MFSLILTIILILSATVIGWVLWQLPQPLFFRIKKLHSMEFLDKQIKYQLVFFIVALLVSLFIIFISNNDASQTFAVGNISSGSKLGFILVAVFGVVTTKLAFPMWHQVAQAIACFKRYGFFIAPLAAVNALSEELIYRGVLVHGTINFFTPWQIAALSALLFSVAHIRGQASGLFVIFGSAIVGWFLATSVMQSHGLFWAWCVHFIQDIVIFTAFVASAANPSFKRDSPRSGRAP